MDEQGSVQNYRHHCNLEQLQLPEGLQGQLHVECTAIIQWVSGMDAIGLQDGDGDDDDFICHRLFQQEAVVQENPQTTYHFYLREVLSFLVLKCHLSWPQRIKNHAGLLELSHSQFLPIQALTVYWASTWTKSHAWHRDHQHINNTNPMQLTDL